MGVLWLSKADKLVDNDLKFRKEYDFIHSVLCHGIMEVKKSDK